MVWEHKTADKLLQIILNQATINPIIMQIPIKLIEHTIQSNMIKKG